MTTNAQLVINGFLKLSPADRSEVIVEINKYLKVDETEKRAMCENFSNRSQGVVLGPHSGSCPCCGR